MQQFSVDNGLRGPRCGHSGLGYTKKDSLKIRIEKSGLGFTFPGGKSDDFQMIVH